jgi:hypothetical protein
LSRPSGGVVGEVLDILDIVAHVAFRTVFVFVPILF